MSDLEYEVFSGNIFEFLELDNADELKVKTMKKIEAKLKKKIEATKGLIKGKFAKPDSEIQELTHELWHLVEDLRQVHVKIDKQHHLLKDIQLIGDCINDKLFRYGILTKQEDE